MVTRISKAETTALGSAVARTMEARFGDLINVKDEGATGDGTTDDTAAIDSAIAKSTAIRATAGPSGSGLSTDWEMGSIRLYFPPGIYRYTGSGFTRSTGAKQVCIVGAGTTLTRIVLESDVYLLTFADINSLYLADFQLIGGKGLIKGTHTGNNVRRFVTVEQVNVARFSECAIGHNANDFPYWKIDRCEFVSPSATTAIGIALNGLTDECLITSNWFNGVKYPIKLGYGGNNAKLWNNFFIRGVSGGAAVWVVPAAAETNAGQGLDIDSNKFGNENAVAGAYNILVADEAAGTDFLSKQHATTLSAGYWRGGNVRANLFNGATGAAPPLIYSCTPNIGSLYVSPDNIIASTLPSYVLEYGGVVTALPGHSEYKGNTIHLPRVDNQEGNNLTAIRGSNLPGAALVVDPQEGNFGSLSRVGHWVGEHAPDYTSVQAVRGNALSANSNTVSSVADPYGGTNAGEWTMVNDTGINAANIVASVTVGRTLWVEATLKRADAQSLDKVRLSLRRNDSTLRREMSRLITLPTNWQRFRFPVHVHQNNGTDAIRLVITPIGRSTGVTDRCVVGDVKVYHAERAMHAGHLQASGADSGAWNGPHMILGAYHLWVDSTGDLRIKSGAPTSDTDGTVVGTQT